MVTLRHAVLGLGLVMTAVIGTGCSSGTSSSTGGSTVPDASTGGATSTLPDASVDTGGASSGGASSGGASSGGASSGGSGAGGSGLADCNGDGVPETQLGTNTDCASCGQICATPNGTARCAARACQVATCTTGFGDCDKNFSNGCETDLTSQHSCGKCGVDCGDADGGVSCVNGACQITKCPAGFDDCNNNPADGCETPLNTLTDCGSCGNPCAVANGTASCSTGVCQVACKTVCPPGADGGCVPGDCLDPECAKGFGDCDGDPKNGCERNTDTSLGDCGKCNNPCNYAHASETCVSGVCTFGTCDPGWSDCSGGAADGCETDLSGIPDPGNTNNILHCGACATTCSYLNAGALCVPGANTTFACQQNGCTAGYFTTSDTTGTCACQLTPNVNSALSCSEAPTVAIADDGATKTFTANEPDLQSDWYHFTFPTANTKAERFHKRISISVTGSFQLEVKDASCALGAVHNTCSDADPSHDPTAVQQWEWSDPCNAGADPGSNMSLQCTNLVNGTAYVAAPDEVWVRVFSTAKDAACTSYVLTVTRGSLP